MLTLKALAFPRVSAWLSRIHRNIGGFTLHSLRYWSCCSSLRRPSKPGATHWIGLSSTLGWTGVEASGSMRYVPTRLTVGIRGLTFDCRSIESER